MYGYTLLKIEYITYYSADRLLSIPMPPACLKGWMKASDGDTILCLLSTTKPCPALRVRFLLPSAHGRKSEKRSTRAYLVCFDRLRFLARSAQQKPKICSTILTRMSMRAGNYYNTVCYSYDTVHRMPRYTKL